MGRGQAHVSQGMASITFFFSSSAENSAIHTLDLSWNQFRTVGAKFIARGLKVGFFFLNPFPNDKFQTIPNRKSLQMTILNLIKMATSSLKGKKTLWEKEKLLINNMALGFISRGWLMKHFLRTIYFLSISSSILIKGILFS